MAYYDMDKDFENEMMGVNEELIPQKYTPMLNAPLFNPNMGLKSPGGVGMGVSSGVSPDPAQRQAPGSMGTDPYADWRRPIIGNIPTDRFVQMAGLFANAVAPKEWSGRMGAGLFQMGTKAIEDRTAYDERQQVRADQEKKYQETMKDKALGRMVEIGSKTKNPIMQLNAYNAVVDNWNQMYPDRQMKQLESVSDQNKDYLSAVNEIIRNAPELKMSPEARNDAIWMTYLQYHPEDAKTATEKLTKTGTATDEITSNVGVNPKTGASEYIRKSGQMSGIQPGQKPERAEKPPVNFRFVPGTDGRQVEPIPGGPADIKFQNDRSKAVAARDEIIDSMDELQLSVSQLLANDAGLQGITGLAGRVFDYPGSKASNARADLFSLKSKVGLNTISALKRGGSTLGQVTEAEHKLLQNYLDSLDESKMSHQELKKSLTHISKWAEAAKKKVNNAYDMTAYGRQDRASGNINQNAPGSNYPPFKTTLPPGATTVKNKKTGKLGYKLPGDESVYDIVTKERIE